MSDMSNLASRLRDPITIQQVALTGDGSGGHTESWSTFASTFAEVKPSSGAAREQVIAAQREARAAYSITLRRRSGVSTAMRILWQGTTLHIHCVTHTRTATHITAYAGGEA